MEPIYDIQVVTTGAAVLTLAEIKTHLRIDPTDPGESDTYLTELEADARDFIEARIGRRLSPTVCRMTANRTWGDGRLYLRAVPVSAVSAVQVRQGDGAYRTLTVDVDYRVHLAGLSPHLYAVGMSWLPMNFASTAYPDFWRVDFTAGYATGQCPPRFRRALKLLLAHWYWNREAVTDGTVNEVPQGFERIMQLGWSGAL